jgi:hypothetical protein
MVLGQVYSAPAVTSRIPLRPTCSLREGQKSAHNGEVVYAYPSLCFVSATIGSIYIKFSMIIYAQDIAGRNSFWSLLDHYKTYARNKELKPDLARFEVLTEASMKISIF